MSSYAGGDEGNSMARPPLFKGTQFSWWKNKMEIFVNSEDIDLWDIIVGGPKEITEITDKGVKSPKPRADWTKEDKELMCKNSKAMKMLHCALSSDEYTRVSACKSAKEIWDILCATYEGSIDVKKNKIDLLVKRYELFKMDKEESINKMFQRFNLIVNELTCLGKVYSVEDQVRKILRSLPVTWVPKITAIEEAKDLGSLALHELIGSLTTYEDKLKSYEEEKEVPKREDKNLALMVVKALKQVKAGHREDEDKDVDVALITSSIRKFFKNGKGLEDQGKPSKANPNIVCYKCKEKGHIARNCPQKETEEVGSPKKDKSKEALAAFYDGWGETDSDSEYVSSSQRHCLVALESTKGSSKEVSESDFIAEFSSYSKDSLLRFIKSVYEEKERIACELDNAIEENGNWANKVLELESVASCSSVPCDACSKFKCEVENLTLKNKELHECLRVEKLKHVEKDDSCEIKELKTRIDELVSTNIENEKKLFSLRFVKEKTGTESTKEELVRLQRKLQSANDRNRYLEEKVSLHEGVESSDKPWFVGQKAHEIWLKQATRNKTEGLGYSSHKGGSVVQGACNPQPKRTWVKKNAPSENLRTQERKAPQQRRGHRNQHWDWKQRGYGNQKNHQRNQQGNWSSFYNGGPWVPTYGNGSRRVQQQVGKSGKVPNSQVRTCCVNCGRTNIGFPKANPMGPRQVWVPKVKT